MPRYWFRVVDGDDQSDDDIGTDFQGIEEAKKHALVVAQELGWRMDAENHSRELYMIDERGEVVFRTAIVDASIRKALH
ncbi:MAG: hypothetical protein QOD74_997 [Variibacter sp.]|jgi:hypothetical protein|nr:hypothetical protein [Variibacter sp.]